MQLMVCYFSLSKKTHTTHIISSLIDVMTVSDIKLHKCIDSLKYHKYNPLKSNLTTYKKLLKACRALAPPTAGKQIKTYENMVKMRFLLEKIKI
jgi:hypothetical protein